ncbi:hypothetical protein HY251_02020 [bacterium]|nr:hypothetical protein [bacterium]
MRREGARELAFLAPAACVAIVVVAANWHGSAMTGVLPNYEDLARIIAAGFDPKAGEIGTPTFPMWGYASLLLLLRGSKLALLVFQEALGLAALGALVSHLSATKALPGAAITALKALLVGALPWYALHAIRWPLSVTASLLVLSLVLAQRAIASDSPSLRATVLSGALLGTALNFRSDAILMPLGLAPALVLLSRSPRARGARLAGAWLVSIYVLLLPWMLYSYRATGHVLLTSTNGGANFYCGLGNLPDNKWGITMSDEDSSMQRVLREKLGGPPLAYLTYEGDRVLRAEAFRLIAEDPGEYLRKCRKNLGLIATSGSYSGELLQPGEPVSRASLRYWLQLVSSHSDVAVVALSFVALPLSIFFSLRERNGFFVLTWLVIGYQTTLNTLSGFLPAYTSGVVLFHLLNVVYAATCVAGLALRRRPANASESAPPRETPIAAPSSEPERI